jgi:hypothetical protein
MAEISMVVTSTELLAPYKVTSDLILELVNVIATVTDDPEVAAAGMHWVQIVEPHELVQTSTVRRVFTGQPLCPVNLRQKLRN